MPELRAALAFGFEGRRIAASPGQSLAAALTAAGELHLGFGKDGSPRGAYCGMGLCHDCLVVVDGQAGQRACMRAAEQGLDVRRQPVRPDIADPALRALAPPGPAAPERSCDLLVVGAGPAGLAAAVAARKAGANVLLVDERSRPGGQYFKQPATAAERARADRQARRGAALIDRARASGVEFLQSTTVWGAERRPDGALAIAILQEGRGRILLPRAVVVATGAFERAPIVPGWTLPGVMASGALQMMLRADGAVPQGRILIAGNGPLNIQVAVEALRRGAQIVGVVEAAPPPESRRAAVRDLLRADLRLAAAGLAGLARLRSAGVPVHWGRRVVAVSGRDGVERVRVGQVQGRAADIEIAADIVVFGERFAPANELSRLLGCRHEPDGRGGLRAWRDRDGRSSLPDIFIAGEAGRFGGARVAEIEGTLAGQAAARGLDAALRRADTRLRRSLDRHERFQEALWRLFDAPHPALVRADDATIVCRCEAVTLKTLRDAAARHGVTDLPTLKRLTRAGMGRCQGRYCAPALASLLGVPAGGERDGFAPQMPLRPAPLVALAAERPEWAGHKRSLLATWKPAKGVEEALRTTEIAVVGAGIAGLSTALFLARAGRDVLVIERSEPNALASGGNAGSLHAQLLSFDHGARAAGAGGPAARTLPLQRDSIALWAELQRELGTDFEMAVTGGLMVAESERDLDFLRAKAAVERAQGVDSEVIGAAALRALEPALSERFLGASLCPAEGKINPLVATQAILAAAEAAGARILRRAAVTGITRVGHSFSIDTTRGPVQAGRVVNAAGAFAATVGRMLGVDVPVHGAPLQMIVTESAAPALKHLVAHADRHLTLKQAANGAFIIGGGWTAGLDPVHRHPRPLLSSLAGNLWVAQRVVPGLDRLHVLRSWAAMNIDIDGAPILGEDPRVPGLFHAVTSNGYTLGPLVGRITADLVDRGETDRDVRAFSVSRFSDPPA